jgi:ubiquinol-cytochrome c reductase iron-sulfur subunit
VIAATCTGGACTLGVCFSRLATAQQPTSGAGIVEVDVSELREGELKIVQWRDKPVWILRRSAQMLAGLDDAAVRAQLADPDSESGAATNTPKYARNSHRSIDPGVFVGMALSVAITSSSLT